MQNCVDQGVGWVGGFDRLWMKRNCPCFTPSRIVLADSARETVSLSRLTMLSTHFCLVSSKRPYDIHVTWFDWFLHRKGDSTALQYIVIHVFIATGQILKQNWKLKWNHLWEQGGPLVFRGPTQLIGRIVSGLYNASIVFTSSGLLTIANVLLSQLDSGTESVWFVSESFCEAVQSINWK